MADYSYNGSNLGLSSLADNPADAQAKGEQTVGIKGGAEYTQNDYQNQYLHSNFYSAYHQGQHIGFQTSAETAAGLGLFFAVKNTDTPINLITLNDNPDSLSFEGIETYSPLANAYESTGEQTATTVSGPQTQPSESERGTQTTVENNAATSSSRTNPDNVNTERNTPANEQQATDNDEQNDLTTESADEKSETSSQAAIVEPTDPTDPNFNPVAIDDTAGINEDATAVTGNLLVNDTDQNIGDTHTVTEVNGVTNPSTSITGTYGTLSWNSDGTFNYALDNNNPAVQGLSDGDTATETFTYTNTDSQGGSDTATLTLNILGTEDAPVISGTSTGGVTEDGALTATGTLSVSDADAVDNPDFNAETLSGTYGDLSITEAGAWSYTFNDSQHLAGGETATETFTVTAETADGESVTETVTITLNGTEDAPVISGTSTGGVTEDGALTATGSIAISDVDADDSPAFNDVASTVGDNGYGSFELVGGDWTFTLDQSATQDLDAGDVVNDTITFTATDGSTQVITVNISGTDDTSVISGTVTGAVNEGNVGDAPVTATGSIAISDVDADDSPAFNDVASTVGDNGYGSFELTGGDWTFTLDQSATQDLDAGDVVNDTITFTATDGSTQVITVNISGTDDASVISGTVTGAVNEGNVGDAPVTATGSIAISDVDADDSPAFNDVASTIGDNGYGSFELVGGDWTFTLDQSATQDLDAGDVVNDTITFTATDGSTQVITVNISGTDDTSVISGTVTGAVNEGNVGDAPVTATGSIAISDVDADDSPAFNDVASTVGDNGYGSFELTGGDWTFTLDQSATQDLDAGDVVNDTITFTATDGSTQVITVNISGTDDASVISGTVTGAVNEGNVGDAPVTATGSIAISDVDADDSPSFNDVASTVGDNGYGSFELVGGDWTFTLDQSATQDLDAGDVVNDTITFTATDGSTQVITVNISGTDDTSVISGTVTGAVNEGNVGDAPVTATGSIAISDVDADDSPSFNDVASTVGDNGYGSFELAGGDWTFTLDQSATQDLDAGDVVNDIITFTATDGSTQVITVNISGTDDASVISGTVTGAVNEGNVGDAPVTATGSIAISDVDADDSPSFNDVASTVGDNGYGSFELVGGDWTFTLDQSATQDLDAGDVVNDTITFTATDGSTQVITVNISGTDDTSVISGTVTGAVNEGNVGDAPVTATGSIAISDVDADDSPSFNDVASTVGDNGYGSFELAGGDWTFTLDQSATQDLDAGDVVNDIITFTATDGSTQVITVNISGTDDASVISGTVTGAVNEGNVGDAPVTATGSIAISDVDADDSPSFNDVASTVGDNGYGSFELVGGDWTFTLDQSATQDLDAGDVVNDTITFTATDGSTQVITVNISGTDDASVISGTVTGAVNEGNVGDAPVTATGSIAISDVDADDSPAFNDVASTVGDNGYGSFELTGGDWTFTLDQSATQDLDAGDVVNDTITFTATDGSTQVITVNISGTDDASVISGTVTGAVNEGNVGDAPVTATGSIAISDVDADDSPSFNDVASTVGDNGYGSFELVGGDWTFTLDQSATQDLDAGDVVNDTITFTSTDGSTQVITVNISGTDDASVISGTVTGAVNEGNVGDAPVTATGSIAISDVDADDSPSFNDVASTVGDNGYGSFELVGGDWTFTLDQSATQDLDAGDVVNDTITFTATDGSTQVITVNISGTDDTSVISGTVTGAVNEGNVGDAPVTATGSIAISDVDADDSPAFNDVASTVGDNGYGSFELVGGDWTFTLDQSATQDLDAGDVVNDTITFTATDGSTQVITVNISGTDDASVISGTVTGAVNEGNVGDAPVTATGSIAISDVDADDSPAFNDVASTVGDNGYGSFELVGGDWTFTLDQSATQDLDAGDVVNDTITFTATDGSTQVITVNISGTDDTSVISGTVTGAVNEGNVGDAPVTATGSIAISDVDADDSPSFNDVASTVGDNGYGSFELVGGDWTFTLDQSATQDLDAGDVVNDTITFTATDGSTQVITVNISGTDDTSVISGTVTGAVNEGNVGDAPVTATGSIAISDVDADDSPSFNDVASTVGDNGYGSFELTGGDWTFTLDQSATQDLDAGDVVNDTITFTSTDGSTQVITVNISGTDDTSVISGTVTGAVNEGNVGDAPVTATGSIAISDVDADDSPAFNDVASTVGDNGYGSFELTGGDWTFTLDQSATQDLDAGDVVNDTITFTATDGSTQVITVNISGTDDASVISGTVTGAVNEGNVGDAPVTATGSIAISDVDADDSPAFNDVASTIGDNGYGSFELVGGDWTFTLDQSATQDLDAGDVVNDTITFTATDGSTQVITVNISGTDDASVISGTVTGAVNEGNVGDAPVTATGSIAISDVDADDSPAFNDVASTVGDNGYGSFELTGGDWTFTLDQSATQDLDAGDVVNDTITFTSTDGSTQVITVNISGTDDASVISGTVTGAVNEGNVGDAPVTATGSIAISDVDADDSPAFNDVASTVGDNGYGSFELTGGDWTFTLDQSATQDLDAGDVVNDTITFTATDGSTQVITVNISGTDDTSVISGTVTGAVNEGNVGDAPVTATGSIAISDVDADDSPSFNDVASTVGDNGYGSFELVGGDWTFTLDQSATQDLDAGDVVNDTITFTSTDGSTQVITVNISGTDDASVISGTVTGAVNEGNVGDAPVTATGSIAISDVDADDSPAFNDVASTVGDNGYGSFELTGGDWTFTLDQSATQDLDAGDVVNDTITFTATDGSTQVITVNISGTDDTSVISGTVTGAVNEGNVGDAPVTATGSIAISDVDADDSPAFNDVASTVGDNGYGSFELVGGDWTFTLDQSATQDLDAGDVVNDTITFTATDGSTQVITVNISGTDDASVISGTVTGAVNEGNVGDAPVTATGSIAISDVDADDSPAFNDVASTIGDNGYGSFELVGGDWTFTLDQSATQDLDAGDVVNDTITFTATDGSTQVITVNISGTDDASVISGTVTGAVNEGNVGDAPVTATGSIAISDVDADDSPAFNDVASTVGDNGYGSFELTGGDWTFTLDQSATQDLDAGDVVNDTITFTSTDGSTQVITVNISGTDDASVISGTVTGAVNEGNVGDAPVTATGSIAISDVDADDSPAFNDVASTVGDNGYGSFELTGGDWTFTLDQSATQDLDAGDVVNDTITFTATDGSTQVITVNISGTDDTSVISGTVTGAVNEGNVGDAPVTATGSIAISDVDADDSPAFNDVASTVGDNGYGSFELTGGDWTFTLDQSATQDLDAGDVVNDTITFTSTDGSTQVITVNISGTDDASVISGTVTGAVNEGNVGDAPVTATGSIAISDVDADDSPAFNDVASTVGDNGYGSFELTGGDWTFTLDQSATQDLDAGDVVNDTITFTSTDGSTQVITVNITGTDDASVISGTVTGAVNEGNVGDAPVTATGSIAISDVDADDSPAFNDVASTVGDNGYGSFELVGGDWTFTLDQSATQDLDAGDVVNDTITFTSTDGSTQVITVNITGTDDASVISGTVTGAVNEGNVGDAPVTATGSIAISDVDADDSPSFNDVASTVGDNGYGSFELVGGDWTFTLDQSATQDLDAGDVVNDTITFTATDGSTQVITVNISGTDDTSVISGTVTGAVNEGNVGDAPVTATGSIAISDVDADDSPAFNDVAATTGDNGYGSFELVGGDWTFTLDQSVTQDLDAGDVVNDTITFTSTDGSTQVITVNISGTDDASVISGTVTGAVNEGNVGDAPVTATGSIAISDVDADDSPAFNDVASTVGDNGYGSFELVGGDWTFTLDQSATQDLDAGDVVNDTITFTSTDGSTQVITVNISGTDDASVISGTVTGAVNEGNVGDAPVTATGSIAISDVDADDSPAFNDVASTVGDNGYGSFELVGGDWTFTLDQSATQDLDAGDVVNDTITFTATDGSTQVITVNISGTDDTSVISGTVTGAVNEGNVGDAPVTATGSIAISDVDADDSPAFNDVASTVGDNGYGSFELTGGDWTFTLDQSATQDLDAGDVVNDTITFTSTDGSTQVITVNISGTDDASVISGTVTGAVNEGNVGDAPVTATGSIAISDVDADDSPAFNDVASTVGDNGYGSFELTGGDWTFTLDQSATQDLDAGDVVNDTITFTATDGSTQVITVNISGTDDTSVISGTVTGAVNEGNVGDAPVTATGSIAISDVDADDSPAFNDVASTVGDNGYGSFELTGGDWTFTLDQSATQDLDAGDVVNDTITFTSTDGSTQVITVNISGTDDASVISGTVTGAVNEGNVGDAPVTATGSIAISDVDADDSPAFNDVASTVGDNGYGSFELTGGDWTFTLDQSATQDLDAGDVVNDTITFTSTDGSTQVITVNITGTDDASVISGTVTGAVNEGNVGDAPVTATGSIAISDVDADDSPAFNDVASTVGDNGYGSFELVGGDWTFTLDQSATQDLDAGDVVNDTITFTATDGSTQVITVNISGTDDTSVISGTVTGAVNEGNVGDAPVTATGSIAISDVDADDSPSFNDVASTVGDNGYGSFELVGGDWTFTLDQSATQDLDAGDVVNDTITFTATDGSTQVITVNISGTDDTSVISGTVTGAVNEGNVGDAPVTATGSIAISDVDADDSPSFNDVASTVGDNGYGSFELVGGDWTFTLDQSATQDLDAGDVVNDTITFTATDGSTQVITVNISGTDDTSVISGTVTGAVNEGNVGDAPVTATGSIAISDVDADDSPAFNDVASTVGDNGYGSFELTGGDWTFTLDQSATQDLDAGDVVNDTITFTSTDGSTQVITVNISGTDDASVISGTVTGAVNEGNVGDAPVTATGSIAISDVDADDSPSFNDVAATTGDNGYGSFELVGGDWTFTLDQSATQDLDAGDVVNDTITFTATDGSTQVITVNISGTDDASVISGTVTGAVNEGNVGDAPVTATGSIAISDVDADDSPAFNDVASTTGTNGYGSFELVGGDWTYTLDQNTVQQLAPTNTVTDSITFTATDGTEQTVTVTITGSNDAPTISSSSEIYVRDGKTIKGQLKADDVDSSQLTYTLLTGPTEGVLTLNSDGSYDYSHNDNSSDSFTYQVTDSEGGITTGTVNITAFNQSSSQTITGGDGHDALDGGKKADAVTGGDGDDVIRGLDGNDNIQGGAGDDSIEGGGGSDTIDGGAGEDWVNFGNTTKDVTVDLDAGTSSGRGNDTITNIENIKGARGDDTLTGDSGDNIIEGGDGADAISGGLGSDTASYAGSDAGVSIDLDAGSASGGHADGDTLSSIENLIGSEFDDALTGDSGTNEFNLGAGTDIAQGGAGADIFNIELGDGTNTIYGNTDTTSDAGAWTDAINLADANTGPVVGSTSGESDWLLATSDSYTITENTLTFDSGDASGTITMHDGTAVTFTDVDEIRWD